MLRLSVYGALLCLIVLTIYVRYYQKPSGEPEGSAEVVQTTESALLPRQQPIPRSDIPAHSDGPPLAVNLGTPSFAGNPHAVPGNNELALKASSKFSTGDYESAAGLFKELAETDKSAFTAVGMSYFKLGNHAVAVEYFQKALESDGNNFVAHKALAFSYYQLDRLDNSLEHAGKGLAIHPDSELQTFMDRLRKESRSQRNFIEESTGHFKVLYDGYEHGKIARVVIGILEDAYRFVGKELNHFPANSVTVILNTNNDFFDTTGAPHWTGGLYDGKIRIPVRGAERQGEVLRKVLFHEYTHAVVHSITPRCPLWINEGLAEYFSTSYPRKIGQLIPLRNIENSFSGLSATNARIAYHESYSAVSYLIEKYGLYRMKEMLESLSKGTDINQAFRNAFSKTYSDFITEWGMN